ncbi:MAG: hypothetical protein WD398_05420 [Cyclobacteriaceae bacterium]
MELIHKRSRKVIWLIPLAGYSSYRSEVAEMLAAMDFVEGFAPNNNMVSLEN